MVLEWVYLNESIYKKCFWCDTPLSGNENSYEKLTDAFEIQPVEKLIAEFRRQEVIFTRHID